MLAQASSIFGNVPLKLECGMAMDIDRRCQEVLLRRATSNHVFTDVFKLFPGWTGGSGQRSPEQNMELLDKLYQANVEQPCCWGIKVKVLFVKRNLGRGLRDQVTDTQPR